MLELRGGAATVILSQGQRARKMSISFIDEILPISNRAHTAAAGGSTPNNNNDTNSSVNPRELHVPSVTLVIFAKDKTRLPSGCTKVILQE